MSFIKWERRLTFGVYLTVYGARVEWCERAEQLPFGTKQISEAYTKQKQIQEIDGMVVGGRKEPWFDFGQNQTELTELSFYVNRTELP